MLLRGHASLVLSEGTLVVWHVDRAPHELLKGHQRTRLASVDANEDADGKCQGLDRSLHRTVRGRRRFRQPMGWKRETPLAEERHMDVAATGWPQPQARRVHQRACGQGHCMSCVWCARLSGRISRPTRGGVIRTSIMPQRGSESVEQAAWCGRWTRRDRQWRRRPSSSPRTRKDG